LWLYVLGVCCRILNIGVVVGAPSLRFFAHLASFHILSELFIALSTWFRDLEVRLCGSLFLSGFELRGRPPSSHLYRVGRSGAIIFAAQLVFLYIQRSSRLSLLGTIFSGAWRVLWLTVSLLSPPQHICLRRALTWDNEFWVTLVQGLFGTPSHRC
jgi:hypothetical protein